MTGSLQVKNGRYHVVLNLYDKQGKRKQKWIATGLEMKNNKRRAEQALQRWIAQYQIWEENELEGETMTFCRLLIDWLQIAKAAVAETTFASYQYNVNSIFLPYFEPKRLSLLELRPAHFQRFYQYELEEKHISAATIQHYHSNIKSALDYAVKMKYLLNNPISGVTLPKAEKYHGSYYDESQLHQLFQAVKGTLLETPVLLAGYYGLRRSEILGLKWSDIDFKKKTLSITGSAVEIYDAQTQQRKILTRDTLKTESSRRTFPLVPYIEQHLLRLKQKQAENREYFGDTYKTDFLDFVCVNPQGELIRPNYVTRSFSECLKKHGLPAIRFHDLRHSCATLLVHSGFPIKDVQAWLGHSSYQTTANIYAHTEYKHKLELAQRLSSLLDERK